MGIIRKRFEQTNKAFIPSLGDVFNGGDAFSMDAQSRVRKYGSKAEQIEANVGWTYSANDFIAEAFASVEMQLYDKKSEKVITDHELITLIDSPNAIQNTEYTFRQLYSTYIKLTGEFYALPIYINDNDALPAAIHILPPHTCSVEWKSSYDESIVRVGNTKTYALTDVIRDIKPDPKNPKEGRGVVAAAASAIDIDEKAKEYNQQFYANSARPSIVVETNEALGTKERKRFEQQFNEQHTGVDSAFKPLIIEGGKVTFGMLTQKEMDFLETRKFTKDEIFAMFKVPAGLVGMIASFNKANIEGAEYNFAKYVLEPLSKKWVQLWNQTLVARYNEKMKTDLIFRHVSTIPEDMKQKLDKIKSTGAIMTIDEQRAEIGLEPLPNGEGAALVGAGSPIQMIDPNATDEEKALQASKKKIRTSD